MVKRRKQSNKRSMLFIMFVMIMLVGVGFVQISTSYIENQEREREVHKLLADIEKEKLIQLELLKTKEEMKTRSFIEEMARTKFGLIYPDETIIDTSEAD